MKKQYKYDFVLSFAGEDREIVEEVKRVLEQNHFKAFYDFDEQEVLLGKDLAEYFSKLYQEDGKYCVMFISKHYITKTWTRWERRAAIARAFKSRNEYILPYFLDNSKLPSIPETIGRANFPEVLPKEFAKILIKKYLTEFSSVELYEGIFLKDSEKTKGLSTFRKRSGSLEYPGYEYGVGLNVSIFNSTDEKIEVVGSTLIEKGSLMMYEFDERREEMYLARPFKIMPHTATNFFFTICGLCWGEAAYLIEPFRRGKYGPPKILSIFPEQTEYSVDVWEDTLNSLSRNNFEIFNNVRFGICIKLLGSKSRTVCNETIIYENRPRFMNIMEVQG